MKGPQTVGVALVVKRVFCAEALGSCALESTALRTGPHMTALPNASNQLVSTVDPASGVQRTLSYNPGGDLVQDNYAGGVTYGYGYNAAKRLVAANQNGSTAGAY